MSSPQSSIQTLRPMHLKAEPHKSHLDQSMIDEVSFLHKDRDILAEYNCAIQASGPFSFAYTVIQDDDVEDRIETHYFAVETDQYPLSPEFNTNDYVSFNSATAHGLPWYLPATLLHKPFRESTSALRFDRYCHESGELTYDCDPNIVLSYLQDLTSKLLLTTGIPRPIADNLQQRNRCHVSGKNLSILT